MIINLVIQLGSKKKFNLIGFTLFTIDRQIKHTTVWINYAIWFITLILILKIEMSNILSFESNEKNTNPMTH